jgi:hypothetical protein
MVGSIARRSASANAPSRVSRSCPAHERGWLIHFRPLIRFLPSSRRLISAERRIAPMAGNLSTWSIGGRPHPSTQLRCAISTAVSRRARRLPVSGGGVQASRCCVRVRRVIVTLGLVTKPRPRAARRLPRHPRSLRAVGASVVLTSPAPGRRRPGRGRGRRRGGRCPRCSRTAGRRRGRPRSCSRRRRGSGRRGSGPTSATLVL